MKNLIGGAILTLAALFCFGVTDVNAQYRNRDDDRWERRDRDDRNREWRRNRSRRNDDDDRWRRHRNGRYGNNGGYNTVYQQQELNRGYQQGINTGASDAQRGQSYSPQRSRHYQRAGSVPFREGFVRGYDQGYRQYAGYRNNRGYGGYGYGNQNELNRGYQQGLETGSSDGQRGQSYDPQRSRHYRNASTRDFREGFVRGYDEGYRRYGNGRYGNGGIGIGDILGGILGRR
jgi:hypothetical protein